VNYSKWSLYSVPVLLGALLTGFAVAVRPFGLSNLLSAPLGLLGVALASLAAVRLGRARLKSLISAFAGVAAGSLLGMAFVGITSSVATPSPGLTFLRIAVPLLLAYIGLVIGISKSAELPFTLSDQALCYGKVLDTSVLIDGRIAEVVTCGFLEGPLVIPRFVLHELQGIADSADSARRARGRRGLDVVRQLQSLPAVKIEVSSQDFPGTREVDLKLIEYAKLNSARIVTNDFNLNKLAQVQSVGVLNINELANCLRPVVLPGEVMRVFIMKEGKEHSQGIAYLDDGTMVVVDNARRLISKNIDIVVTSVLQTTAGKMIFGRYDASVHAEHRPVTASAAP